MVAGDVAGGEGAGACVAGDLDLNEGAVWRGNPVPVESGSCGTAGSIFLEQPGDGDDGLGAVEVSGNLPPALASGAIGEFALVDGCAAGGLVADEGGEIVTAPGKGLAVAA